MTRTGCIWSFLIVKPISSGKFVSEVSTFRCDRRRIGHIFLESIRDYRPFVFPRFPTCRMLQPYRRYRRVLLITSQPLRAKHKLKMKTKPTKRFHTPLWRHNRSSNDCLPSHLNKIICTPKLKSFHLSILRPPRAIFAHNGAVPISFESIPKMEESMKSSSLRQTLQKFVYQVVTLFGSS